MKRRRWDKEEDDQLKEAVSKALQSAEEEKRPISSWIEISSQCPGRNPKQCRDRWKSILCGLKSTLWTATEDEVLLQLHHIFGPKWTTIQERFPHRSDNSLKARFRLLKRRHSKVRRIDHCKEDDLELSTQCEGFLLEPICIMPLKNRDVFDFSDLEYWF